MAENFDLIFGQNASQQYAWSDNDYQNGWGTVGNIPPTAAQFDALQRRADTKAQELNNNLTPLVAQNTANNRQPLTTYALKDIRYSPLLPTGWFLECAVDGTTASGEITVPSPLVENATITDGTVVWKVRKISSADGMPIGAIIAFAGNGAIPSGYLLCDGAAYSRTALPDLFSVIGTDYGSGDGSTTFNVPDSNQAKRFLQGDTVAGTVKQAGLPNVEGSLGFDPFVSSAASVSVATGPFIATGGNSLFTATTNGTKTGSPLATFNLRNANPIYGNSDTVQPPALTIRFIIKAFDGQTADSALIDITQYANELAGKADRSLSNLTDAGKSFIFPSETYVSVTTTENPKSYTAPADGYIIASGYPLGGGVNAYVDGGVLATKIRQISRSYTGDSVVAVTFPVKKGDIANAVWSNCHAFSMSFVYAQGEVPE